MKYIQRLVLFGSPVDPLGIPGGTGPAGSARTDCCCWRRTGLNHHGLLEEQNEKERKREWVRFRSTQSWAGKQACEGHRRDLQKRKKQKTRRGSRDMRREFAVKWFINNCCNAEYISEQQRSSLMGDDAYWRVPDGWDYYREIEPRLRYEAILFSHLHHWVSLIRVAQPGHWAQPQWDTIRPVCCERLSEAEQTGALVISRPMAAGEIKTGDNWITQKSLAPGKAEWRPWPSHPLAQVKSSH